MNSGSFPRSCCGTAEKGLICCLAEGFPPSLNWKGRVFWASWKAEEISIMSETSFPCFSVRASLFPPLSRNRNDSMSRNDKWWNLGCDKLHNKIHVHGGDCWMENKTRQVKKKWGGTSTDIHHCAGISEVRLEEEVIYLAWLGRMQSGEQRKSSNWKQESSWGSCQGHSDREAAFDLLKCWSVPKTSRFLKKALP